MRRGEVVRHALAGHDTCGSCALRLTAVGAAAGERDCSLIVRSVTVKLRCTPSPGVLAAKVRDFMGQICAKVGLGPQMWAPNLLKSATSGSWRHLYGTCNDCAKVRARLR